MCGRFALLTTSEQLQLQFPGLVVNSQIPLSRYNIAPGQPILMIRQDLNEGLQALDSLWGLIPFWSKEIKSNLALINARSEILAQKPVFKKSFQKRRGLVLMSGFFEWKSESGEKKPYYFTRTDNALLAVASIWESRLTEKSETIVSCALITTQANALMEPIHNRMPVIVSEAHHERWLNNQVFDEELLSSLMQPKPLERLVCFPVTPKMNNARFDNPEVIEPIRQPL